MVPETESGHFDPETGNFTGLVGELVHDRGDVCFQAIRVAGIVDEIRLVTPTTSIELHALVSKGNITNHSPDVMEAFDDMSGICYMAFATLCAIVASFIALDKSLALSTYPEIKTYSSKLAKVLWSSVQSMIDQENLPLKLWPSRIGWWWWCVGIFVIVHGYLLNLIKTDLAVPIKPKVIDRLDDFFEPEFEHVMPIIYTTFWFLDRLVGEPPNTMLGRLYRERMLKVQEQNGCERHGSNNFSRCPIISFNVNDPSLGPRGRKNFKHFADGNKALLTESLVFLAIKEAGCAILPKVIKDVRLTEDSFATDTVAIVMRSDLPLAFREYYEHRARAMYLEAGFQVEIVRKSLREEINARLGESYDWNFEKCMIDIFDGDSTNDDDEFQLPLKRIKILTNISMMLLGMSCVLLISEIVNRFIWRIWQKVQVRNRTIVLKRWKQVQPKQFYLSKPNAWQ